MELSRAELERINRALELLKSIGELGAHDELVRLRAEYSEAQVILQTVTTMLRQRCELAGVRIVERLSLRLEALRLSWCTWCRQVVPFGQVVPMLVEESRPGDLWKVLHHFCGSCRRERLPAYPYEVWELECRIKGDKKLLSFNAAPPGTHSFFHADSLPDARVRQWEIDSPVLQQILQVIETHSNVSAT